MIDDGVVIELDANEEAEIPKELTGQRSLKEVLIKGKKAAVQERKDIVQMVRRGVNVLYKN